METVYKSVVSGRFDKLRQNYDGRAAAAVSLEMISHCIIKAAAAQAGVSRRHGPFAGRRRPCAGKRYVKTNKSGELKLCSFAKNQKNEKNSQKSCRKFLSRVFIKMYNMYIK